VTDVCFLKALKPGEEISKKEDNKTVSGLPFRLSDGNEALSPSLFCFEFISPTGIEPRLLKLQYTSNTSIFTCDEFAIYSRERVEVTRLITAVPIDKIDEDHALVQCQDEAEEQGATLCATAKVFTRIWSKVIAEGRFRFHQWTVKTDPDAVFLPKRLRLALGDIAEPEEGVYLNNCPYGLCGSLEVLSRRAVQALGLGLPRCTDGKEEHLNVSSSREDAFLDRCLSNVLRVTRVEMWNLLNDMNCRPDNSSSCQGSEAAFHPLKTLADYGTCLATALLSTASEKLATVTLRTLEN